MTVQRALQRKSIPRAGATFILVDEATQLALAVADQQLEFDSQPEEKRNCWWRCVESNGWFGFMNAQSGTYLGHDALWTEFHAVAHKLDGWESFQVKPQPSGGFILTALWWSEFKQLIAGGDRCTLTHAQSGGIVWDFTEVLGA